MRRWASNNHAQQDFDDYVQAFATIAAAAAAENLQVISPTVRKGTGEGQEAWWLAQFLGACNEDTTYSCDEDAIALLDLHNYHCKASKWGTDSNSFLVQMKDDLKTELTALVTAGRTDRSASEWATWVDARSIWVTETSCALHSNTPYAHTKLTLSYSQVQLGAQPAGQRRQLRAQRRKARRGVGHGQRDRARQLADGVPMGLVDELSRANHDTQTATP